LTGINFGPYKFCNFIKNDHLKNDRINFDRIKINRIKTDRIKRITDPYVALILLFNVKIITKKQVNIKEYKENVYKYMACHVNPKHYSNFNFYLFVPLCTLGRFFVLTLRHMELRKQERNIFYSYIWLSGYSRQAGQCHEIFIKRSTGSLFRKLHIFR
jgi:hypothetical protein